MVMVVVLVYTVLDGFLPGVSFPYIFGFLAQKSIFWYIIGHFPLFQLVLSLKVSGELLGLHAGGLFGYGGSVGGVRIIAKETSENCGSRVAILYCIGWVPFFRKFPPHFHEAASSFLLKTLWLHFLYFMKQHLPFFFWRLFGFIFLK